jgi:hypothetical protein
MLRVNSDASWLFRHRCCPPPLPFRCLISTAGFSTSDLPLRHLAPTDIWLIASHG